MAFQSDYITFAGINVLDAGQLASECEKIGLDTSWWSGRANSFFLPRGREPGTGYFLISREDLDNIDDNALLEAKFFSGTAEITFDKLLVVVSRSVAYASSGGGSPTPTLTTPYLVEVSDVRGLGKFSFLNAGYNVRAKGDSTDGSTLLIYEATQNSDTSAAWTWDEMLENIWKELPTDFGLWDDIEKKDTQFPTEDPSNYEYRSVTAWDALNHALETIHHSITLFPKTGEGLKFEIFSLDSSDDDNKNKLKDLATVQSTREPIARLRSESFWVPEKIKVVFPRKKFDYNSSDDKHQHSSEEYWKLNPVHEHEITTTSVLPGANNTRPGTVHIIHDPADVIFLGSSAKNQTELEAKALDIATKFLNDTDPQSDVIEGYFGGAQSIYPQTRVAAVGWFDVGEGMHTVAYANREANGPKIGGYYAPIVTLKSYPGQLEYPGPPDVGINQLQYPGIIFIKLTEDLDAYDKAAATIQFHNSSGIVDAISWEDLKAGSDPVSVEVLESTGQTYSTDDILPATWNWHLRRWTILSPPGLGGFKAIHFVLQAALTESSPEINVSIATFTEAQFGSGRTNNETIATAKNGSGLFEGPIGTPGIAIWHSSVDPAPATRKQNYEIVNLKC